LASKVNDWNRLTEIIWVHLPNYSTLVGPIPQRFTRVTLTELWFYRIALLQKNALARWWSFTYWNCLLARGSRFVGSNPSNEPSRNTRWNFFAGCGTDAMNQSNSQEKCETKFCEIWSARMTLFQTNIGQTWIYEIEAAPMVPWRRGLHGGIVSACHRGDWSHGSWDRIPLGYTVVALKNSNFDKNDLT
jgi:hypothetical protein